MARPKKINPEEALEAALSLFWCKGYEGTSYADLASATGVERPALYAAFGNKEALFLRALERYDTEYARYVPAALALPTSREVAESFLLGAVELNTRSPDRLGCLGVNGALAASTGSEPVRKALVDWRGRGLQALKERLERAKAEGDLSGDADPEALASYLLAVAHGIAVQAKAGFTTETLQKVAGQALSTWPGRKAAALSA